MKLLITGANGFVGKSLIVGLRHTGHEVFSAVRGLNVNLQKSNIFSVGNIGATTNWNDALDHVDTVIHLAARVHIMSDFAADPLSEFRSVNTEGSINLARQAVKAGVKRFIFVSSIKVNGEFTQVNKPFTASDVPSPQDAYSISKCEAEQGLLKLAEETGLEVVIIRPPLIYGNGVKANFASMMRAVKSCVPLPFGAINNKRSFVYVGNLISLILRCIDHPSAANQVFLVSDGNDLSTTELLKVCAQSLGVKARLLPVPQCFLEFAAKVLGKRDLAQRLCGNLQVDITKTRQLLGWEPQFTIGDGLKEVALALH